MSQPAPEPIFPTNVTRDHATGIGLIVVNWCVVENAFRRLLRHMLGGDMTHALTVAEMQYRAMSDLFRVLVEHYDFPEDLRKKFNELHALLQDADLVRNAIVHANAWLPGEIPNSIRPLRVKARGKIVIQGMGTHQFDERLTFTPERLFEEAANMQAAVAAMSDYIDVFKRASEVHHEAARRVAEEMMEETKSAISSSEGAEPPK